MKKLVILLLMLTISLISYSQSFRIGNYNKVEIKYLEVPYGKNWAITNIEMYGSIRVTNDGEVETTINLYNGDKGLIEMSPASKEMEGRKNIYLLTYIF